MHLPYTSISTLNSRSIILPLRPAVLAGMGPSNTSTCALNRCVDNCEVITVYSKPRVVSLAFYSLLRGDTIKRLYILTMCAGVIAAAISVPDQKRIFLGFALCQGVFLPTVVVHSMLLLHSVPAMFCVVLFLLFAPLGVPLGVIYETHVAT